ncbi:MAG: hypothetical protein GJ677_02480 [Rhodobacteraceae bacterium]|nr:hypothetical protein [Paracoccaceae bacterium]
MSSNLVLFLPFYTPRDPQRSQELLGCLKKNLDCGVFSHVYLLQDDDTVLPFQNEHLTVLRLSSRPTYLDWVRYSKQLCPDAISVLANSDIHFQEDITKLYDLFELDPKAFVALSRYDKRGSENVPHQNPHWSQDTWAFLPAAEVPRSMERQLDIALGTPRCDNKIAYVFSLNGFEVYNPFHDITSIHVHETELRYYDKKGDTSINGCVAMVHDSPDLLTPAQLDIEIWSQNSAQYSTPRINRSLERWAKERALEAAQKKGFFAHNADWQYPAVTEQQAHDKMAALMEADSGEVHKTAYLAFPWATLIDLKTHAKHRADKIEELENALSELAREMVGFDRIVTVCQHIRMREWPEFFQRAGVTDVFWSHCETHQDRLPGAEEVALHPFPLFPVQQVPVAYKKIDQDRPYLFSFVGAKSSKIYLTQSRNMILDELKEHPNGKIIDRNSWHYNKIVYDAQILEKAKPDSDLVDNQASVQFREIMENSTFSLCPSGTGPNSIRLWEAALNNSIPVVMADTYQPPGDKALWDLATIHCMETVEAIRELPQRLQAISENPELLARKRRALWLLVGKYGPDRFVHDILQQFFPERAVG